MRKSRLLTAHVESHFGAGRHGGIGIRRMNSDASDRLSVTWSLGQNLANTVGCPSARIIYLSWVYLGPQRPHLSLAHVPAYRPENLHFQWLFCNNSYSLPFNTLLSSSSSSSGSLYLAHVPRSRRFIAVLYLSLTFSCLVSQPSPSKLIVADYSELCSSGVLQFRGLQLIAVLSWIKPLSAQLL